MPYLFALIFIAGLGLGGWGVHDFDSFQLKQLKAAIAQQKYQASNELMAVRSRVDTAETKARQSNDDLEKSRSQSIATINAYHEQLVNLRLFKQPNAGRGGGGQCTVSKGAGAGQSETGTRVGAVISERVAGFIKQQSYRSDQLAVYAKECYEFVSRNCGISLK